MKKEYQQTGGLRWGESFWSAANATWPFAKLTATSGEIRLSMRFIGLMKDDFAFAKSEIDGMRRKKGILPFSTGIIIEHHKASYPRFILFWTFGYQQLKTELTELDFEVTDK